MLWISGVIVMSPYAVAPSYPAETINTTCFCHNAASAPPNPDRDFEYRKRLAVILPTLTQIDATQVFRA